MMFGWSSRVFDEEIFLEKSHDPSKILLGVWFNFVNVQLRHELVEYDTNRRDAAYKVDVNKILMQKSSQLTCLRLLLKMSSSATGGTCA